MTKKGYDKNWTSDNKDIDKQLNSVRSGTLRTLVVLYLQWKEHCAKSPFGMLDSPSAEWIMERTGCSRRTAYDYSKTIAFLIGNVDIMIFGEKTKMKEKSNH